MATVTAPAFDAVRKRTLVVLQDRPDTARYFYLSSNSKTGASVNFSVAETCQPTRECRQYCYAVQGGLSWPASIGRHVDNARVAARLADAPQAEVDRVAAALALDVARAGVSFLRWNGSGDLTPGTVRVINALALLEPALPQWVITRKATVAAGIADHAAIRVLVSLDASTTPKARAALLALRGAYKLAAVRVAFVRRRAASVAPTGVDVVFNEHGAGKRSGDALDPRTCMATVPDGGKHDNACESCRRCFADRD